MIMEYAVPNTIKTCPHDQGLHHNVSTTLIALQNKISSESNTKQHSQMAALRQMKVARGVP
jgi:hypothetical protein